jgi:cytoskeletal protein RodZ
VKRPLAAVLFSHFLLSGAAAQQPATLASLIPAAEVIVVARISKTDYTRTPSDGPMTAQATALNVLKGGLKRSQSLTFHETAWVGPTYQVGEVRILFLEPATGNQWRIVSNLYAKTDFFIEPDAVQQISLTSLRAVLGNVRAPAARSILITRGMLR